MVLFVQSMPAQTSQKDTIYAKTLLRMAEKLQEDEAYEKSNKLALQVASITAKANNWQRWYDAYYTIFLNGYFSKNYETSIQLALKARTQLPQNETRILSKIDNWLGIYYEKIGLLEDAIFYYEKSLEYLEKVNDLKAMDRIYGNLGSIYTQKADYWEAQKYAKIGIFYAKKAKDTLAIWKNTKALGDAYFYANAFEKAQNTYQKAKQLQDDQDGTFELNEAKILYQQYQYEDALNSVNKAIALSKHCKSVHCENIFLDANELLGKIYLVLEQPKKALQQFQLYLASVTSIENKRVILQAYIHIGDAYQALERYDEALENYQTALHTEIPAFTATNPIENPPQDLWTTEIWLLEIFRNKGDCFLAKYHQSSNEQWLQLAATNYENAVKQSEIKRLNFTETTSKLALGSYVNEFYEALIHAKFMLHDRYKKEKYLHEAFQISQRANAFVLRELTNEQTALQAANIPTSTLTALKNYKRKIAILNQQIQDSIDIFASVQKRYFAAKELKFLKKSIIENYPKFKELRNDLDSISVADLQLRLKENTQLIKYFLGEKTLYCFSFTKKNFFVDQISLPTDFEEIITTYRQSVSDLDYVNKNPITAERQYLQTASTLFKLLLKTPLQHVENQDISELTIIPDGILQKIPFQTLLMKPSDSWTKFDDILLKKYAIGAYYFCKMIGKEQIPKSQKDTFTAFGVALDDRTQAYLTSLTTDSLEDANLLAMRNSLAKLTFANDEAIQLAKLMKGNAWTNQQATKTNFLVQASRTKAIHLATHALVNIENPNTSSLLFTKANDSLHNLLSLDEIYQQDFNADMITLSACNTGFGKYHKGEGLQSLARAFNFANIPSVTATLWSIPDASSAKIMKLYYGYLQQGFSKNIALQKAQLHYIENDEISSPASRLPFYWAAWTHIGDDVPITITKSSNYSSLILLLSVALLIILGVSFFVSWRKK
jgi:CHAT domain-containing protein